MRLVSRATSICGRFADLLIPRFCAGCREPLAVGEDVLCTACGWQLAAAVGGRYCTHCGQDRGAHLLIKGSCTACRLGERRLRFERFVRVGRYDGALRRLVLRFKREFVLDRLLGGLLRDAIAGQFDPELVDYWVPIPAHWWRRLSVGFQPTALLARSAVRGWGARVEPALKMTRYVRPFHHRPGMTAAERAEAIQGAFRVVRPSIIAGRTICLVDDVTTTGSTLGEAGRVLRAAGAGAVFAAVIAKTGPDPAVKPGLDRRAEGA